MKKILALTLAFVMCISLFACTDEKTTPDTEDKKTEETEFEGDSFYFEANGDMLVPGEQMDEIDIAIHGEPAEYFESESCAFQGLDKVYTYPGFVIRTYPDNGMDYILNIELRDDSVSTPEGCYIGDTESTVRNTYGEPSEVTATALIYKKGSALLYFTITDGEVTAITYTKDM